MRRVLLLLLAAVPAACAKAPPAAPPFCPAAGLDAAAPRRGVPIEVTPAGACLAARAQAGDAAAAVQLGDFYDSLPATLPLIDRRGRELHWYRLAADHGSPQAAWSAAQLIDRDIGLQVPNDALAYAIFAFRHGIDEAGDFLVEQYQDGRIDPGKLWSLKRWMDRPGALPPARRKAMLEGFAKPADELEEEG